MATRGVGSPGAAGAGHPVSGARARAGIVLVVPYVQVFATATRAIEDLDLYLTACTVKRHQNGSPSTGDK
jgi:hypothetical protein